MKYLNSSSIIFITHFQTYQNYFKTRFVVFVVLEKVKFEGKIRLLEVKLQHFLSMAYKRHTREEKGYY